MPVLECTFRATLSGQTHENVAHFRKADFTAANYEAVATNLRDTWLGQVKQFTPSNLTWTSIRVRNINNIAEAPFTLSMILPGTSSHSEGMPPFVCFLLKIHTAVAGRTGRGRWYQSSPLNGHMAVGVLNQTVKDFIEVRLAELRFQYIQNNTFGMELGVCKRGTPDSFKPATNLTLDSIARVQRRRNIGVGV